MNTRANYYSSLFDPADACDEVMSEPSYPDYAPQKGIGPAKAYSPPPQRLDTQDLVDVLIKCALDVSDRLVDDDEGHPDHGFEREEEDGNVAISMHVAELEIIEQVGFPEESVTLERIDDSPAGHAPSMNKEQLMQLLEDAPPAQAKQILGDYLYRPIAKQQGSRADKITGMLLEGLDKSELVELIDDEAALQSQIVEALETYQQAQAAASVTARRQAGTAPDIVQEPIIKSITSPISLRQLDVGRAKKAQTSVSFTNYWSILLLQEGARKDKKMKRKKKKGHTEHVEREPDGSLPVEDDAPSTNHPEAPERTTQKKPGNDTEEIWPGKERSGRKHHGTAKKKKKRRDAKVTAVSA